MFIIFTVSLYSISPKEHYDLAYNNDIEINGRLLFYTIIENITRIFYLLHSIYFTILSFIQIIRHKKSIQNYYANYEESRIKKIYTLNIAVSVSSVIFIIFSFLDKNFFIEKEHLFIIPSLIIMCMFFIIGLLGNNQHSAIIDPEASSENIPSENINPTQLETIKKKIEYLFEVDKIYLNKELNLWELSRLINTNRTYITLLIGNYYNKNFSTFVNHYRLKHVENLLNKNPELTNEDLANLSGFGSVISMQRAFQNIEGKTISQIKKKIIRSKFDTNQE
jgi:AraC-like DNA-binding protein